MRHAVCQVCQEATSKYCCPACNAVYCSLPCYKEHKKAQCDELKVVKEKKKQADEEAAKQLLRQEADPVGEPATKNARPEGLVHPLKPSPVTQMPVPETSHLKVPTADLRMLLQKSEEIRGLFAEAPELKAKLRAIWQTTDARKAESDMKALLTMGTEAERQTLTTLAALNVTSSPTNTILPGVATAGVSTTEMASLEKEEEQKKEEVDKTVVDL